MNVVQWMSRLLRDPVTLVRILVVVLDLKSETLRPCLKADHLFVSPTKRQKLLVQFMLVHFSTRYEVKPFHAVAAAAAADIFLLF